MHIYLYYSGVRTVRGLADRPDRGVSDPSTGGPSDYLRLQEVLQGVIAHQSYLLLFPTNNVLSLYDDVLQIMYNLVSNIVFLEPRSTYCSGHYPKDFGRIFWPLSTNTTLADRKDVFLFKC